MVGGGGRSRGDAAHRVVRGTGRPGACAAPSLPRPPPPTVSPAPRLMWRMVSERATPCAAPRNWPSISAATVRHGRWERDPRRLRPVAGGHPAWSLPFRCCAHGGRMRVGCMLSGVGHARSRALLAGPNGAPKRPPQRLSYARPTLCCSAALAAWARAPPPTVWQRPRNMGAGRPQHRQLEDRRRLRRAGWGGAACSPSQPPSRQRQQPAAAPRRPEKGGRIAANAAAE